jgi:hypothetical protein
MRRRAAWLGARIREEDGVGRAVEVIHACFPAAERRGEWPTRPERALHGVG